MLRILIDAGLLTPAYGGTLKAITSYLLALALAMGVSTTTMRAAGQDIVDTAAAAGQFNTLVKALEAAELVETLKGAGPFTVFAPTDEAFAKLPAGTLEGLLRDRAKLTTILTYHVVPGKVMAKDAAKLSGATTVEGTKLKITARQGRVMIDDAEVIKADIDTSNGVIHVIDTVLIPKD
jgi:uncharacterized surface protein with fasciclin (FAS1) repeats